MVDSDPMGVWADVAALFLEGRRPASTGGGRATSPNAVLARFVGMSLGSSLPLFERLLVSMPGSAVRFFIGVGAAVRSTFEDFDFLEGTSLAPFLLRFVPAAARPPFLVLSSLL